MLLVGRSRVRHSSVLVFLVLGKNDVVLSDGSQLAFVLDVAPPVVHVVSVSDESTFHRLASFEVDGMASFDDILETVGEPVSKSVGDEQVSNWVFDVVVRDEEEH